MIECKDCSYWTQLNKGTCQQLVSTSDNDLVKLITSGSYSCSISEPKRTHNIFKSQILTSTPAGALTINFDELDRNTKYKVILEEYK
ncbi:MAG: hypothetical protein ACTSU7_09300 [Candidatus Heimdallarchaeaceae archaeon]